MQTTSGAPPVRLPPSSLWMATATPPSASLPLEGEHRPDVCIIGGGFTDLKR